jgi:BNR repeat-containing family member
LNWLSKLVGIPSLAAILMAGAWANAAVPAVLTFNDDGGWNWLQDKRVVVAGQKIYLASVATGRSDPDRAGDVEVVSYDLRSAALRRFTLHHETTAKGRRSWKEDHNCPALFARPDGRILAMYSQHGEEPRLYSRILVPGDPGSWSPEKVLELPTSSRVACPNLQFLSRENGGRGRLYVFYRGLLGENMPSWSCSDDLGENWVPGGVLLAMTLVKHDTLPYVKYGDNGDDTIQIAYTLGHQQAFGNCLYHLSYRGGRLLRSDGTPAGSLAEGRLPPEAGTRIFQAGADDVTWISDVETGPDGRPCIAYTLQENFPDRKNWGEDHRFRYALWTGSEWSDHEIAFAGSKLHQVEGDSCTGLIALDPEDTSSAFISTNADPAGGTPLVSSADGRRHWEIFHGSTADRGRTWSWTAVTRNSSADNIRPVIPRWRGPQLAVVWLKGAMRMPDDYDLSVVGIVADRKRFFPAAGAPE